MLSVQRAIEIMEKIDNCKSKTEKLHVLEHELLCFEDEISKRLKAEQENIIDDIYESFNYDE